MTLQNGPSLARSIGVIGSPHIDIAAALVASGTAEHFVVWQPNSSSVEAWSTAVRQALDSSQTISISRTDGPVSLVQATSVAMCDPSSVAPDELEAALHADGAVLFFTAEPTDLIRHGSLARLSRRDRCMSAGTVALSAEFRRRIADRLRVDTRDVQALTVGSDGEKAVPLWSSASVAGIPLHQWAVMGHGRMSVRDRTEIFVGLKESFDDPDFARAANVSASVEIIQAIVRDSNRVLPVGTFNAEHRGIANAWLALPCIVNAKGAEPPLEVPMNDAELAGLRRAAEVLSPEIAGPG